MRPRVPLRGGAVLLLAAEPQDPAHEPEQPITRWNERAVYVLCHSDDIEFQVAKLWAKGYRDIRLFDEVSLTIKSELTITITEKEKP